MAYIGKVPTAVPLTGADIQDGTVQLADLSATGTKDATTFLRGDNTFAEAGGGTNTPFFFARKDSDQIINHSSFTKITFDSVDTESSSGVFDLTNNKFTVTEAGKYNISINVYHYDSDNNIIRSDGNIVKNGTDFAQWINDRGTDQDERGLQVGGSIIMNLSVDDYIEAYALATTSDSGTVNIEGSASRLATYLSAFKIIE